MALMGIITFCVPLLQHYMFDIMLEMMPVNSFSMTVKPHYGMKQVTGEQHIWLGEESVNTVVILLALEEPQ